MDRMDAVQRGLDHDGGSGTITGLLRGRRGGPLDGAKARRGGKGVS